MNYKQWFKWYKPTLRQSYAKAFLDYAVEDEESFADWCGAEYEIYQEDPNEYEVPYTGILD